MEPTPPETAAARLAVLRGAGLLDGQAEPVFDRLTLLAHRLLGAPLAMVSLVDGDRQHFKSFVGLAEPWATRREVPLSRSFCAHTVAGRAPFVVEDARVHPRLVGHPAIEEFGAISYLGVPLLAAGGEALGTFCVIDSRPRGWTEQDLGILRELARSALTELELRNTLRRTEREQADRLDAERRRALAQLGLGLRHEINNALAGLLLAADLLAPADPDPALARNVEVIRLQAHRIASVLQRLEHIDTLRVAPYLDTEMIDVSPEGA